MRNKKIVLIMLSTILPSLMLACFALTSVVSSNGPENISQPVDLRNLKAFCIGSGDGNIVLDNILDRMQQLGAPQIQHVEIRKFYSYDISESLIILDGTWISKQIGNSEIHRVLREAASKRAKLVAVGGLTSEFFEALDKAGVNELCRDEAGNTRNPAYFDPPLVGFKLKEATTPEGHSYQYPSIFVSNSDDIDTLIQALTNWLER